MKKRAEQHEGLALDAQIPSGDLSPANPLRPPGWRWQLAGQLLQPRARRRRQDDDWVVRARRFRVDLAGSGGDIRRPRMARVHGEVLAAYQLRQAADRPMWELEARILAGQDDRDIAVRMGVDAGTVGAYQAIYFDVRCRLANVDLISACVLAGRLYEGFDVDDTEAVWKVIGFQYGPTVLDALIDDLEGKLPRSVEPGLVGSLRLLVQVTAMPATSDNSIEILRLNASLLEIDGLEAGRSARGMNKPITIPHIDVHLGPRTVPMVRASCASRDALGDDPDVENGPIVMSDAC